MLFRSLELVEVCPALAGQLEEANDVRAGLEALVAPLPVWAAGPGSVVEAARPRAVVAGPRAVVAGSLHLLGEVIPWLDPEPDLDCERALHPGPAPGPGHGSGEAPGSG